ncbi:hypothetical protein F4803DRAFT_511949 [Xylaria telfairii]|nr:hypothetical protein F4803DRAFT_511949 [Xylaria telfairii]
MAILDRNFFSDPLAQDARKEFVDRLWPDAIEQPVNLDPYFCLVENERQRIGDSHLHAINTYSDIVFIIDTIRSNPSFTFMQITELLKQKAELNVDPQKLSLSIELSIHLWLMTNIRNRMTTSRDLLRTSIPWVDDVSLSSAITSSITHQSVSEDDVFPKYLNVHDMGRICGYRVVWTDDLGSHLTIEGSSVYIFHNTSVLKRMNKAQSFPLPGDYVNETLATIDLLIPITNPSCNIWLSREISLANIDHDISFRNTPVANISKYKYWQERLKIMNETFERARPRNLSQWVYDTRDMERWWGFWLVVIGIALTVFFGLVQSITGILQVTLPH